MAIRVQLSSSRAHYIKWRLDSPALTTQVSWEPVRALSSCLQDRTRTDEFH